MPNPGDTLPTKVDLDDFHDFTIILVCESAGHLWEEKQYANAIILYNILLKNLSHWDSYKVHHQQVNPDVDPSKLDNLRNTITQWLSDKQAMLDELDSMLQLDIAVSVYEELIQRLLVSKNALVKFLVLDYMQLLPCDYREKIITK